MIRALALLAALALAGCDASPEGADGYRFGPREWTRPAQTLELVEHDSARQLQLAARARQVPIDKDKPDLMAWSEITDTTCRVHVVRPEVSYAPEWIGHEVAHCFYGRWHR